MKTLLILKQWVLMWAFSILLLSVLSSRGQGNLVFNGNFESGSLGWTLARGAHITGGNRPGLEVFLGSTNASPANEPTASQTISGLIPNITYTVSGEYHAGKDRG
ncbi:MAG: hypothetical protein ACR2H1_12710, partial [Limisphaerales bacterium]